MRVSASLGQAVMQVRISDRRHWRTLSRRRVSADDRLSSGTAIETGLVPLAQEGREAPVALLDNSHPETHAQCSRKRRDCNQIVKTHIQRCSHTLSCRNLPTLVREDPTRVHA